MVTQKAVLRQLKFVVKRLEILRQLSNVTVAKYFDILRQVLFLEFDAIMFVLRQLILQTLQLVKIETIAKTKIMC